MLLFLLLLFPIVSIWLLSEDQSVGQIIIDLKNYFLYGVLLFAPSFLLVNIFISFLSRTYTVANIYFYYLFAVYFFYHFFCILSCAFRFRYVMCISTGERMTHYFLFMAGFYTAFAFFSAIQNHNSADFYTLFLKPVSLLIMAAYTSFFMTMRDSETGLLRYLLVVLILVFPAILGLVPFFYYIRYPIFSFAVIFVLIIPGGFLWYRNRYM
ncbi:MAG: hypothetical protein FWC36_07685 [Spirochaetes bacterium]|nr:hypothetical protein [Spirochaetota bacterium]